MPGDLIREKGRCYIAPATAPATPHNHTVPTGSTVTSVQTADGGILLYGVLAVSALLGMDCVGKKRH